MPTLQSALDNATGADLADALAQRVSVGAFLKAFVSPEIETVDADSDTATLTKTPIHGSMMAVMCNGVLKHWRPSGTVAAGQFTLSGKVLTFYATEGHATTVVAYLSLEQAGDDADVAAYSDSTLTAAYPATTL